MAPYVPEPLPPKPEAPGGWMKTWGSPAKLIALTGATSAGVMLAVVDLMKNDPKDTFALLENWGPKVFFGFFLLLIFREGLMKWFAMSERREQSFTELVRGVTQMGDAMNRLSNRDDRQVQEMQTLTAYTAQQSEKMHYEQKAMRAEAAASNQVLLDEIRKINARMDANSQQRN